MGPGLLIARATPLLVSELAAVEELAFASPWDAATLTNWLASGQSRAWLARDGEAVCGFALFLVVGSEAELLRIAVVPARRRLGIATGLLAVGSEELAKEGLERLLLEVRPSNQAALRLYGKFGFRKVGKRPRYYEDGEDAWVLARSLRSSEGS